MNKRFLGSIKGLAKKSPRVRMAVLKYNIRHKQPSWEHLIEKDRALWEAAMAKGGSGEKVLIATSVGAHLAGTTLESMLSAALTLRGAEAHVLLCDKALPACLACWYEIFPSHEEFSRSGPSKELCDTCYASAKRMYESMGLKVLKYSDFLSTGAILRAETLASSTPFEAIGGFTLDGLSVGEHALAGALRYFARGDLIGEAEGERVLRRYFLASLLTTFAMRNLIGKNSYGCAVFHHGIYVPQGLIGEVCRASGVRVVNWNPGYRKNTFIFSHGDSYHHTMITEPVEKWNGIGWNDGLESELLGYLKSRWEGTEDWIWFHEKPEFALEKISKETGIDFRRPCVGMLTSVVWDAQLHYRSNAFSNILDWVEKTIKYFMNRPDLTLIIRVHPAEIHGTLPSRQKIADEIKKNFPGLTPNIVVIPPESRVSTYAVMSQCDSVIIYNTKTGIELSSIGIPVIVAGVAWIWNKGFSLDVSDPESYYALLERLPLKKRMSPEETLMARKYAYHFFFRRMIQLGFMPPTGGNPPFKLEIESLGDLAEGASAALDVICEGILKGKDFIYTS